MASSQTHAKEKFNKEQREGFAKILDGIAQAYVIGITIGSVGFAERKISIWLALMLFTLSISLVYTAFKIRSSKESPNVN